MRVNGTLVEDKMRRFRGECDHFRLNKCPIYTHDGASAKFRNNSQEMDNSAVIHFVSITAKFGICTIVGLNGTLVDIEAKNALGTLECAHFSFKKLTHDGANAKFSTN